MTVTVARLRQRIQRPDSNGDEPEPVEHPASGCRAGPVDRCKWGHRAVHGAHGVDQRRLLHPGRLRVQHPGLLHPQRERTLGARGRDAEERPDRPLRGGVRRSARVPGLALAGSLQVSVNLGANNTADGCNIFSVNGGGTGDLRHAAVSAGADRWPPSVGVQLHRRATSATARSTPLPKESASGSRPPRRPASPSSRRSPAQRRSTTSTMADRWGGGAYWAGGGRQWRTGDPSESDGPFASSFWGWQMVCGAAGGCTANAGIALNSVLLTGAENRDRTSWPTGANNLFYQTSHYVWNPVGDALSHPALDVGPLRRLPCPGGRQRDDRSPAPSATPDTVAVAAVPRRVVDRCRRRERRHASVRSGAGNLTLAAAGIQRGAGDHDRHRDPEGRQRPRGPHHHGPGGRRLGDRRHPVRHDQRHGRPLGRRRRPLRGGRRAQRLLLGRDRPGAGVRTGRALGDVRRARTTRWDRPGSPARRLRRPST